MNLWAHQQAAVTRARWWNGGNQHLALFYEMGTGKTATMIQILREQYSHQKALSHTLIFAPLSVCPQWKAEFAKFSKIDPNRIHVMTGAGKKRAAAMERIMESKLPAIVVTNYESVQMEKFYEQLLKWSPDIVIMDESQRIKDSSGVRAKGVYPLAMAARRRFLLSGTPISNQMMDIFGQYKAMDRSVFGSNFFHFKTRFFYDKNANMPKHAHFPDWVPLPNAERELGVAIGSTSVQAKKSECLDLPPLLRVPVPVELSPEQLKTYSMMAKHFVTELGGKTAIAEFAMTKTLRLQQIIAGFIVPDEVKAAPVWVKDNPRLDALDDLLGAINGQKTIIWSVFKPTYAAIAKVCKLHALEYRMLTGEQSATEKQQSIEDFCRGPAQVLIANPAAGGVGVNLTEAKFAIYYTRGFSLEQYLQSEARNYRGGSDMHDKVVHYHLQATGTLDEVIAQALLNKQSVAESVLGWARQYESA